VPFLSWNPNCTKYFAVSTYSGCVDEKRPNGQVWEYWNQGDRSRVSFPVAPRRSVASKHGHGHGTARTVSGVHILLTIENKANLHTTSNTMIKRWSNLSESEQDVYAPSAWMAGSWISFQSWIFEAMCPIEIMMLAVDSWRHIFATSKSGSPSTPHCAVIPHFAQSYSVAQATPSLKFIN